MRQGGQRWLTLACWFAAVSAAMGLHAVLEVPFKRQAMPEPVRVALKAAPARAQAPAPRPVEVLPIATLAPKSLPKARPAAPAVPPPPAPAAPEKESPAVSTGALLDLTQPALANPQASAPTDLPPLAAADSSTEDAPPKPPEDAFVSQYSDAPGANVVVVALLVNPEGDVIDSKLVIPSRYRLKDLGLQMASRQQKVTGLKPPLAPGEVRWIEVRLVYPEATSNSESIVP